jgi:ABC-type multidrug transport system ATPase subunit
MAELQVRGLIERCGDVRALAGVDLDVAAGELFVILGLLASAPAVTW